MPGIDYTLGMKTAGFTGGIQSALGKIGGIGAALTSAFAAAGGLVAVFKSVQKAADMESTTAAFTSLTGSVEVAKKTLADLAELGAATPFEFPELAAAGRKLIAFGEGADTVTDTLRVIGDVSAGIQAPIGEIAELYGKARTQGRLFGEDINQLTGRGIPIIKSLAAQFGVAESDVTGLVESGKVGFPDIEKAFQGMTGQGGIFFEMMKRQSETFNGKVSNLKDGIGRAMSAFGEPITDAVKPFLDSAIGATGTLTEKAAEFGTKIGEALGFIAAAFSSGEITGLVADGLKLAFQESVNFLYAAMRGNLRAIGQGFIETFRNAVMYFEILTTPDFWKGMGNAMIGVSLDVVGFLQRGLAEVLEAARPLAELFGKGDSIIGAQKTLTESAGYLREEADKKYAVAGDQLKGTFEKIGKRIEDATGNMTGAFMDGFQDAGEIFDTAETRQALAEGVARTQSAMQENATKAAAVQAAVSNSINGKSTSNGSVGKPISASIGASRPAVDRLAQIGLFVGGAARGLSQRAAEKTASYMEKAVVRLTSIDKRLSNPTPAGVFL